MKCNNLNGNQAIVKIVLETRRGFSSRLKCLREQDKGHIYIAIIFIPHCDAGWHGHSATAGICSSTGRGSIEDSDESDKDI